MKLILNKLIINNFKGIKELSIDFDPSTTSIFAANEAGKTTISDAWHWLLTGKNSADQKDFNIKNTADTSLNRADHEVTAYLSANGSEVILQKVYKEKWQKKRGSEATEFTGNETLYFFNEVPVTQSEYQSKISGLLSENVLKMITNPLFFNSNTTNWTWKQRREVLLAIAGTINDTDVFDSITTKTNRQEIANLNMVLASGKTMQEYKVQIGAKKKKLKEELAVIPARIDEANRSKPQLLVWSAIEEEIKIKNSQIATIDESIADQNKALQAHYASAADHQAKVYQLIQRKNEIKSEVSMVISKAASDARIQKNDLLNKRQELYRSVTSSETRIQQLTDQKIRLEKEVADLRSKFSVINAEQIVFDDNDFSCPTCRRPFEDSDVSAKKQTLTDNFVSSKVNRLEQINQDGKAKADRIKELANELAETEAILKKHTNEVSDLTKAIDTFVIPEAQNTDEALAVHTEFIQVSADLARLQTAAPKVEQADNSALVFQKNELISEIDELKKQLNWKTQIEQADKRVIELEADEKSFAQQLADLERSEFLMDAFDRAKMDIMEARVDSKFKYVKFRLFDRQVNGGESPTCETIYKDVPFSDLNTAGRIWAGMDIINTLNSFYGVEAPIFLDNRESVSEIPETTSQVINLVVSPQDKSIRIETGLGQLTEV